MDSLVVDPVEVDTSPMEVEVEGVGVSSSGSGCGGHIILSYRGELLPVEVVSELAS